MTDTIKLKTFELTFIEKEIDLPTHCPGCGLSFWGEHGYREDEWAPIIETRWEPWEYTASIDEYPDGPDLCVIDGMISDILEIMPTTHKCGGCGYQLS